MRRRTRRAHLHTLARREEPLVSAFQLVWVFHAWLHALTSAIRMVHDWPLLQCWRHARIARRFYRQLPSSSVLMVMARPTSANSKEHGARGTTLVGLAHRASAVAVGCSGHERRGRAACAIAHRTAASGKRERERRGAQPVKLLAMPLSSSPIPRSLGLLS